MKKWIIFRTFPLFCLVHLMNLRFQGNQFIFYSSWHNSRSLWISLIYHWTRINIILSWLSTIMITMVEEKNFFIHNWTPWMIQMNNNNRYIYTHTHGDSVQNSGIILNLKMEMIIWWWEGKSSNSLSNWITI